MMKILLLDDDQGNLDVLYLVYIDEGYNVLKLSSAKGLAEIGD
jgi:CheY-like chemotaxis protein